MTEFDMPFVFEAEPPADWAQWPADMRETISQAMRRKERQTGRTLAIVRTEVAPREAGGYIGTVFAA